MGEFSTPEEARRLAVERKQQRQQRSAELDPKIRRFLDEHPGCAWGSVVDAVGCTVGELSDWWSDCCH